jgi:uncharacterized membrane protein YfcA
VAAAASAVAGAAGVLAGMVGLGGGTMIGPILLEFKIHPQVRKHAHHGNLRNHACWIHVGSAWLHMQSTTPHDRW